MSFFSEAAAQSIRVSRETLGKVMEAFSESGHTNIHQEDIILDFVFVENRKEELAELLGVHVIDLPTDGLIHIHP